jgi:hypothetical protein
VRLELALTGGFHHGELGENISGLPGFWFASGSVSEGFAVDLPFAGARLGVYKTLGASNNHLVVGAIVWGDVDLGRARGSVSTTYWCGLQTLVADNCPASGTQRVDATIGTLGAAITLGWTHDFGL